MLRWLPRIIGGGLILGGGATSWNVVTRHSRAPIQSQTEDHRPVFRILTIDGGGIRGIIPATILKHIEEETKKPIHEHFHLIAGTSTGAVLACGLAKEKPLTAAQALELYSSPPNGNRVFYAGIQRQVLSALQLQAKYDAGSVESLLKETFGTTKLSGVVIPLLATSFDLKTQTPFFFKSWKARGQGLRSNQRAPEYDWLLADVARSSSAAPTYFEPKKLLTPGGEEFQLIDGAVAANNPSACAFASAKAIFRDNVVIQIVSLGTGDVHTKQTTLELSGGLGWISKITDIFLDSSAEMVDYQLENILQAPDAYFRVNPALDKKISMDDVSPENLKLLSNIAKTFIKEQTKDKDSHLSMVLEMLKEPKSDEVWNSAVGQDFRDH